MPHVRDRSRHSLGFTLKNTLCISVLASCVVLAHGHRQAMAQAALPTAEDAFATMDSTARFLTQSTFGPVPDDVVSLTGSSPSNWLLFQFDLEPSLNAPLINAYIGEMNAGSSGNDSSQDDTDQADSDQDDESEEGFEEDFDEEDGGEDEEDTDEGSEDGEADSDEDGESDEEEEVDEESLDSVSVVSPNLAFWRNAIEGPDQLRQRMAFALSQIFVVSNAGGEVLTDTPWAMGYYQDLLTTHALGNYRDLLEAVTYSPAMGYYLTYLGNRKGDPVTGRVPDENYAREVMQLFTIGLVELNLDGTTKTDANGNAIETYTNDDITGLAKVFTGLAPQCDEFELEGVCGEEEELFGSDVTYARPMQVFPEFHSSLEKSFLGTTIPAGTGATESITQALDTIFNHPNVAPFVSRQLIQRFVTSHPSPAYIERVATAFEAGSYVLPNGSVVGDARRGDLKATVAAILFDDDARSDSSLADDTFGKVREPVIRFTNWARAFQVSTVTPEHMPLLWDTSSPNLLGQRAYGASSVFNFYRPGYVAPGTLTGAAGLTVPELQIVNAATTPGYINFMTAFITGGAQASAAEELQEIHDLEGEMRDTTGADTSFRPNYDFEFDLASDAEALVDRVEAVMTYITLSPESKSGIVDAINAIPYTLNDDGLSAAQRVHLAILMVMTTPDYLVQR